MIISNLANIITIVLGGLILFGCLCVVINSIFGKESFLAEYRIEKKLDKLLKLLDNDSESDTDSDLQS